MHILLTDYMNDDYRCLPFIMIIAIEPVLQQFNPIGCSLSHIHYFSRDHFTSRTSITNHYKWSVGFGIVSIFFFLTSLGLVLNSAVFVFFCECGFFDGKKKNSIQLYLHYLPNVQLTRSKLPKWL